MKNSRTDERWARVLVVVLVAGIGACKSTSNGKPGADGGLDTSVQMDLAGQMDQATMSDTPVTMDAGATIDTATPENDGGMADATTIDCVPGPTGGDIPAGTAPMQAAGPVVASSPTRPELTQALVDSRFTIKKVLAEGGGIAGPGAVLPSTLTPDAGALEGTPLSTAGVTNLTKDDWDPQSKGIGDPATFTPTFTVAADGSGTHTTITDALFAANQLGVCGRVYIRVTKGDYREQALLPNKTSAPAVTLYSTETDARLTRIVSGMGAPLSGSMSASATLRINALSGFQLKNMTIANDYVPDSQPGDDQSGVALLIQSDRSQFENVRFLGRIATLYVKSRDVDTMGRTYFRDCYVEGDQDVIIGRGTAVFDHTEIKSLAGRPSASGTIAAPSTIVYASYGFLFDSCTFTADDGVTGVFLARQWYETQNLGAVGKMIVRNSTLGAHIAAQPWSSAGGRATTPKNRAGTTSEVVYSSDDFFQAGAGPDPVEQFIGEYGNSGPGAHQ